MRPKRHAPPIIQTRVRLPAALHARVTAEAAERGVSFNEEIVERVQSGTLTNILSEGEFGLGDLARFQRYVQTLKIALTNAGEDQSSWFGYAKHVPFPATDLTSANELVGRAVEEQLREDRAEIKRYESKPGGPPIEGEPRRRPSGSAIGDVHPFADYSQRKARLKRVEMNRRRRASIETDE